MPSSVVDGTFNLTCTTILSSLVIAANVSLMVSTMWTGPGQITLHQTSGNISKEDSSHESQLIVSNAGDSGTYSCTVTLHDTLGSSFISSSTSVTKEGKGISYNVRMRS